MSKTIVIRNGTVATLGKSPKILEGHSLLIESGKITRIAPASEISSAQTPHALVIDARGKLVMPGLINAHMHFYSTLVRGLTKAANSSNFNEVLTNLWWRLDRKLSLEDTYVSALLPLVDAVRKGTTTLIDHHASPGAIDGSLNQIARAVKESGLRASLCYELSDRDGEKVAEAGLKENIEFIQQCKKENDPHLKALFGLHASFTVSERTLSRAVQASTDLEVGFHVHTAEASSDQEHAEKTFSKRVVERFHQIGVLGPKTICAHGVHLSDHEMELLARTQTALVHNPQSNMNNAVGIADIVRMKEKGILVGLGTDAMTVNMFEEARTAVWAQKLSHKNPGIGFVEPLDALLWGNPQIANRYWNLGLGELREGAAADVILVDYFAPTPLSADNFLGHFCFGLAQSQVDTTIASGKVLMLNKQLQLPIDEERLAARSRELAQKLWDRF